MIFKGTVEQWGTLIVALSLMWLSYRFSPAYRRHRYAQKTAEQIAWLLPALLERKEFCELIKISDKHSHYFERHGPLLKIEEMLERANTGQLVTFPHAGQPVNSSRWFFHGHLYQAVISALELWDVGERPKGGQFDFCFPHNIGEGYLRGSSEKLSTNLASVIVRDGSIISAYPILAPRTGTFIKIESSDIVDSNV
jgi:hypothetical protein